MLNLRKQQFLDDWREMLRSVRLTPGANGTAARTPLSLMRMAVSVAIIATLALLATGKIAGAVVPTAPTSVGVTSTSANAVTVTWTDPTANGAAITGYNVVNTAGTTVASTTNPIATSLTFTPSAALATTTLAVVATSTSGPGATSSTVSVGAPATPSITSVTPGNGTITIVFTDSPYAAGALLANSSYTVYANGNVAGTCTSTTCTLTDSTAGLSLGATYSFTVTATNVDGTSSASSPSPGLAGASPSAITGATATVNYGASTPNVTISWNAPSSNGGTPVSYSVSAGSHVLGSGITSTSLVESISSLFTAVGGTSYSGAFTVTATNGSSLTSSATTNTVFVGTTPAPPTAVTVGGSSVSWTASASGSPYTYEVQYETCLSSSSSTCTASGTPVATAGTTLSYATAGFAPVAGTYFDIAVYAVNNVGVSAVAVGTPAIIGLSGPGAPSVVLSATNSSVTATWTPSTTTGGSAIVSYSAQLYTAAGISTPSTTVGSAVSLAAGVTTYTFTGLAPGNYAVSITPSNASGAGTPSGASPAIVVNESPYGGTLLTAPTAVYAASTFNLSWIAAAATSTNSWSFASYKVVDTTTSTTLGTVSGTVTSLTGIPLSSVHAGDAIVVYSIGIYGVTSVPSNAFTLPASISSTTAPAISTDYASTTGIQVNWASVTGATSYNVIGTGSDLSRVTATVTGTSTIFYFGTTYGTGTLTSGVTYTFQVAGVNPFSSTAYGTGVSATTAATAPSTPVINSSVTTTNTSLSFSWSAVTTGNTGSVTYSLALTAPNGAVTTITTTGTSYVFTGLTPNTPYSAVLTATAPLISSAASAAVAATTIGTPAAATGLTAVASATTSGSVTLTWVAPTNLGGSSTSLAYALSSADNTGGGATPSSSPAYGATTATLTGLSAGHSYTFTLTLNNNKGTGTAATVTITLPSAPAAPTAVTSAIAPSATSTGTDTVTWTAPATTNGAPITGYTVTSSPSGATCAVASGAAATATSQLCSGLTANTAYTFTVTASNAWGTSSASTASTSLSTVAQPTAPTLASAGTPATGITVGIIDADPTVTGYTLQLIGGPATLSATVTGTSYTFPASVLTVGVSYSLEGYATNAAGNSNVTGPSATPTVSSGPGSPLPIELVQDANTTLGVQGIVIFWAPVTQNGFPMSYTVYGVQNGVTTYSTTTTNTFVALPYAAGYTFTVYAKDAAGTSTGASPTAPTTLLTDTTLPSAPVLASTASTATSATVTFSAPTSGSTPITGYLVTLTPASGPALTQTLTSAGAATFGSTTSLSVYSTYTYSVVAETPLANGPALTGSVTTTANTPGAPTGVTAVSSLAVSGVESVVVTWVAPASTGGLPLTGYNVYLTGPATVACPTVLTGASTTCTIPVSTVGAYQANVVAATAAGYSSDTTSAATASFTSAGAPAAPTITGVTTTAIGTLVIAFTEPASTQLPLIGFNLETIDNTTGVTVATAAVAGPTATSITVTGLAATDTYTLALVAANDYMGATTTSTPAIGSWTGWTVPEGAPSISSATNPALGTIAVAWTAPVPGAAGDKGSIVSGYTVTATNTSTGAVLTQNVSASTLSTTFTGLANGVTYSVTVAATNSVGSGAPTTASVKTGAVSTAPAPTLGAVTATSTSLTFSWTAPTVSSGTTITGYVGSVATGNTTITCGTLGASATSCTISGLTPSTTYTISVSTLTAGGTSVAATKTAATTGGTVTGPVPSPFQVLFAGKSTALTAAAKKTLVTYALKLSAGGDVTLTGYAKGNAFLAKSRATTVALFLEAAVSNLRFQLHEVTSSSANSVFVVTVTL